jgi:mono/diheme cytochrome c family protein
MRTLILLTSGLVAAAALLGDQYLKPTPEAAQVKAGAALVSVTLPDTLTAKAEMGKLAFEAKCAVCHGINAAGNPEAAPPLVHIIYEPGHHSDESFQRAAALGVQAHHWRFGNMPPVEGITRAEVETIIAYIRELQRANGIF